MADSSKPKPFWYSLVDPEFVPSALRVALIVGTILFAINHGTALWQQRMTPARWRSALLTYVVPYSVNIHGQHTSRVKAARGK